MMRRLVLIIALVLAASPALAAVKIVPLACESSSDTSGPLDLGGAVSSYLAFGAAGMSNGDTAYYQLTNNSKREEGLGTYTTGTPNTWTRDASANSTDGLATPLTLSGNSTICIGAASGTLTAGTSIITVDQVTVTDSAYGAGWNGSSLVPTRNAVYDKIETLQPLDSDLTSWAGVTRASGFDTFATTPSVANLASLLTDEPLSSSIGGTGNGFTKFTGPASSEKTMTLPNASSTLKVAGTETVFVPAAAMFSRATSGASCGDTYDSGSNDVTVKVCAFDTTTQEFAHFQIAMPKNWDEGTFTFEPVWTNTGGSSTQTVVFGLACVFIRNDDTMNAAMGTAQTSTDTWLAQNDNHIGPASSAITCGGTSAESSYVAFQINRTVASDNMAGDALLLGIRLYYTTNAANDS